MSYMKVGLPWIYDDVSGDIVGIKDADGGETLFVKATIDPTTLTPRGIPYILSQGAVPIALAPSGTMGANGAVTLDTALQHTFFFGVWMYFPAGAVFAGSAAGYYWTVMSSTTAGTVYTNTYTPRVADFTPPSSPTAVVDAGPGAYTGVSGTEITAVSVTLPGGALGNHGGLRVYRGHQMGPSDGGTKTHQVRLGSTGIQREVNVSNIYGNYDTEKTTRNSGRRDYQITQSFYRHSAYEMTDVTGTANLTNSNTSVDRTLTITLEKQTAVDYDMLLSWTIEVLPS